ncbi:metallophosphoesterase [Sediminicola luteus]|uniref:Metallophosphoesterase n=1 Tax=Sediminicola luteus TaxID=319238 RepID=A0A2A4GB53_9FLAO|nr:metallophosphoesterase [Sediminicola luteus]PCE66189.1 metallophosphoesterase [Sediminicola luteus]
MKKIQFWGILFVLGMFGLQAQTDSLLVKPYLQYATQNSIHVLWETTAPASTLVEYGEAQLDAVAPNLSLKATLAGNRLLHEVPIDNLKPATKYVYRVTTVFEGGKKIVSPVYTFGTAVNDEDAYFFAFIGDSQRNSRTPKAWQRIAQRIWGDRPNFIVHAGDLVDSGNKKTDWTEHFFPYGHVAMSRFPMYTVLGNHEEDAQLYYDYFVNPEPEYYYTFKYGNAQFFMVDTNRDVREGSEQFNWLERELANSTATWKFVVHHHPPYSSEENDHGDTAIGASSFGTDEGRNLVPLYEAYGVDFCLYGHTHVYERSWPLKNNAVDTKNGVIYINSGGAGGGLEDFDPTRSWFTQELETGHHYTTFAIFDNQLLFKAISDQGRLFDTFQLQKDSHNASAQVVQPVPARIRSEAYVFEKSTQVSLEPFRPNDAVYYTLDGSEPTQSATRYTKPFTLKGSAELKSRSYTPDGKASRMVSKSFERMAAIPASKVAGLQKGLRYKSYEGEWNELPDFNSLKPVGKGVVKTASDQAFPHRDDNFGVLMEGYLNIPETGTYTFYTYSDDGSQLFINDRLVVDNDGAHGKMEQSGTVILKKGYHKIKIGYFDMRRGHTLSAGFLENRLRVPFHPGQLWH